MAVAGEIDKAQGTGRTPTPSVPLTLWNVALISASPWATAVTRPVDETVATPGADDCHVACCVTSDVVPVLCVAVATSCRVCPASIGPDASPLARTWTALVVGVGAAGVTGAGLSEPQATTARHSDTSTRQERPEMRTPDIAGSAF